MESFIRILNTVIGQIYRQPLGAVMAAMLFCMLVWGILGSRFSKQKVWKWLNVVVCVCSVLIVLYITESSREETDTILIVLQPFHGFIEAKTNPEMYRSMLMNVLLFLPVGLSMPYALPQKISHKTIITVLLAFALSVGIEAMQYYFHLGLCETDDVIMNTSGALLGSMSYRLNVFLEKRQKNS